MISIPFWWFILLLVLSAAGIAAIIWLIIRIVIFIKEYNEHL